MATTTLPRQASAVNGPADALVVHRSIAQRAVAWLSQTFFARIEYTQRHGFARGMRRVGGLGWIPAAVAPTAEDRFWEKYSFAGKIVADIGAFQGVMTLGFARLGAATIYSFEPCSVNRAALVRNVAANRLANVQILDCGLSDETRKTTMGHDPLTPGLAAVGQGKEVVQVRKLDDFGYPRIDLLKIDVEGHEINVLRGAVQSIARWMPDIVLELHGDTVAIKQAKTAELISWLKGAGYTLTHIESGERPDATRHFRGHLFAKWQ